MSKVGVVLVAGGSGKRMNSSLPKQFISVAGKTILQHSIDRFFSWNNNIELVLVLPQEHHDTWEELKQDSEHQYTICEGGKERYHSVKNGLKALKNSDVVFIHDAVRPMLSHALLDACLNALKDNKGVIPLLSVKDSIRFVDGGTSKALNRDQIKLVQTPQCFHYDLLMKAYEHEYRAEFTDDASVFEAEGNEIAWVEGEEANIKITTPSDLDWLKKYLERDEEGKY